MVNTAITALVQYGIEKGLIEACDAHFATNALLEILQLDSYEAPETVPALELEAILKVLLDDACARGVIEDSIVYRDILDTRLMGAMTPYPHEVRAKFNALYAESPEKATTWYYDFSQNTDYIRRYRIAKDVKWVSDTKYGKLDITINLSKPEKDPKAIAAAKNAPQSSYPKCMLCDTNEGYAGRANHPARQNHRIMPLTIGGNAWYLQYSPYVYYNEHCICFHGNHQPMKIERNTFEKMFDFVKQFPHYFVGSNADLPIVGGSILTHDHFQGGHYTFAMAVAPVREAVTFAGYEDVQAGIVEWPMSVIRLRHADADKLVDLADKILGKWRAYTDVESFIYAETEGEPHNTITPIARMRDGAFELDLVLRNNITTAEFPMGVYHPHQQLHHIKKENIGLIEVMGLAVLPARLKTELETLKQAMVAGADITANETIAKHADWVAEFTPKYGTFTAENVDKIVEDEVGLVFAQVLEDAGVYKADAAGKAGILRFVAAVNA